MPDIIHLLPDSVANQIAAGEVVLRPASVIKELVENAVDAGANKIDVFIVDAGRTSIQVVDDGKGMSETDARLAFERHATSKIFKAEDLSSLLTMGFRGEALPSIAAVSQLTLRTRQADQQLGTKLRIEGSRVVSQELDTCAVGSNFIVNNLFYNLPARRKGLKTPQTELNNIIQEFERMALVNPSIMFTFHNNGSQIMNLPPANVLQRIVGMFGKKVGDQLIPVETDATLCRLSGYVGRPESARKRGAHQYFFVNGRFMRHPYFHKAVMEAFEGLIPEGEQISYFLYFDVDPSSIDVNRNPTKTEIQFDDEPAIWRIIISTIKYAFAKANAVPLIDFDEEATPNDIPVYIENKEKHQAPEIEYDNSYNPFASAKSLSSMDRRASLSGPSANGGVEGIWAQDSIGRNQTGEAFYTSMGTPMSQDTVRPEVYESPAPQQELYSQDTLQEMEKSSEYFQYRGQYILTTVRSGLMLIDQHRAHVRVLYSRYMKIMEGQAAATQGLLFPELLQLPLSDMVIMDAIMDDLHKLGFELSPLGGGSYSVLGTPPSVSGADPLKLLKDIVDAVRDTGKSAGQEIQHRVAQSMAHHAALPVGQVLSRQEMENLVGELFATDTPSYTPDGKTILTILPQENLEKMFR